MVVTRRTPVVPPPTPLVHNPSAHGAPRPSQDSKNAPAVSRQRSIPNMAAAAGTSNGRDHTNGLFVLQLDTSANHRLCKDDNPGKKSKKARRRAKNKHQKSNFQSFFDFLTKLLLLAFTIYTFSVCPQDVHLQSPICRGLSEYKRIVLDPYIIPPIQAAFAHPSVAPHIERAKPYVHRVVEITTPILLRTQQQWNLHVVPQWNNHIVPQWNKHLVSRWDKYIEPRIQLAQSRLEPFRERLARRYEQLEPRVQVVIYKLQLWQYKAEPYVLLAASKTKDAYYTAKPYAVPLVKKAGHQLQQFALFLRVQRQKFVDPHVAKIWEKVKELSRGSQVVDEIILEHESLSSDTLFTIMETIGYEATLSSTHSPTFAFDDVHTPEETDVMYTPSSFTTSETTEVVPRSGSPEPSSAPVPPPEISMPLADTIPDVDPSPVAEYVLAESADKVEPLSVSGIKIPPSASVAPTPTFSSQPPPDIADEPTESPVSATPSKIPVPAASATIPPNSSRGDDEIDFDAFYAELGLDEPLANPGNPVPPSPPSETEQERAERLRLEAEETARKRADIEVRHAKWETELHAQMERSTSQLQSRLADLRAAAAAELESSVEIRSSIEELVSEAEKYIKGAEIYLKNLKGEARKPDEKLPLWDRVVDRVNDKFNERLLTTQGVVNAWYGIVLEKELQEVATAAAEVREIAEKGQLDLGLDYAWLEDVTFNDWQRYHALVGVSEQYGQEAASIQNGTNPSIVPMNPMSPIFEDLESEVQDVLIGFETRLRRIKRDGERAFNSQGNGVAQKEEEKGSVVKPDGEPEPEVSILPIPHNGVGEAEDRGFIPPIIIGRSQQEVLEALGKVQPLGDADRSGRGSNVDPEEAVSRLAQEVEGGAEIYHTEL